MTVCVQYSSLVVAICLFRSALLRHNRTQTLGAEKVEAFKQLQLVLESQAELAAAAGRS
jgi:hypothetical protein